MAKLDRMITPSNPRINTSKKKLRIGEGRGGLEMKISSGNKKILAKRGMINESNLRECIT